MGKELIPPRDGEIEEIALRQGYISLDEFEKVAQKTAKSSYGEYLMSVYRSFKH